MKTIAELSKKYNISKDTVRTVIRQAGLKTMTQNGRIVLTDEQALTIESILNKKYKTKSEEPEPEPEKIPDLEIKVLYHDKNLKHIEKISVGDWIDLRSAENVSIRKGHCACISLGVSIELPHGYEAHIIPRSSTFKTWHILQTNNVGLIDSSYCGENDIWKMPVYALTDTVIHKNDRICQFRIVPVMPAVKITEVKHLHNKDRGGIGSTGKN